MSKQPVDILDDLFGKRVVMFTKKSVEQAMQAYANQFRWVETTCKKRILFDDLDYEVLRQQNLFYDNIRNHVMAVWIADGKRIVAPIAKLMLDIEGKSVLRYKDKDPLNLRRNNIEFINHQKAHYKVKKARTASGNPTTSKYKGVSWSKFAKKWVA